MRCIVIFTALSSLRFVSSFYLRNSLHPSLRFGLLHSSPPPSFRCTVSRVLSFIRSRAARHFTFASSFPRVFGLPLCLFCSCLFHVSASFNFTYLLCFCSSDFLVSSILSSCGFFTPSLWFHSCRVPCFRIFSFMSPMFFLYPPPLQCLGCFRFCARGRLAGGPGVWQSRAPPLVVALSHAPLSRLWVFIPVPFFVRPPFSRTSSAVPLTHFHLLPGLFPTRFRFFFLLPFIAPFWELFSAPLAECFAFV